MVNSNELKFVRVYITGYGRSGSSALDRLISRNFNIIGLGEVKYLNDHRFRGDTCSCGENVNNCCFWSNSPKYWSDEFKNYVKLSGAEGIVDSSKTTFDSFRHFKNAIKDPDTKFIEIQRCYIDVMKSILKGTHNPAIRSFWDFGLARLTRATINFCWTRFLYLIILRKRSILISQERLKSNPKKVVSEISNYLKQPVYIQNFDEHQVAGNPLFHTQR